ncbi:MAG: hypothetical protein ABIP78_10335 [Pyrinomonadaceae bacterium]
MHLNYYTLLIFAPLLILTGILGFIIPAKKGLTSGAPAYNVFHIIFGLIGLGIVCSQHDPYIRAFNIGFGALDLYQAAASYLHMFPEKHFRWKRADDVLHIVIGGALVLVGLLGS